MNITVLKPNMNLYCQYFSELTNTNPSSLYQSVHSLGVFILDSIQPLLDQAQISNPCYLDIPLSGRHITKIVQDEVNLFYANWSTIIPSFPPHSSPIRIYQIDTLVHHLNISNFPITMNCQTWIRHQNSSSYTSQTFENAASYLNELVSQQMNFTLNDCIQKCSKQGFLHCNEITTSVNEIATTNLIEFVNYSTEKEDEVLLISRTTFIALACLFSLLCFGILGFKCYENIKKKNNASLLRDRNIQIYEL